jgi:hypothetical protein
LDQFSSGQKHIDSPRANSSCFAPQAYNFANVSLVACAESRSTHSSGPCVLPPRGLNGNALEG